MKDVVLLLLVLVASWLIVIGLFAVARSLWDLMLL